MLDKNFMTRRPCFTNITHIALKRILLAEANNRTRFFYLKFILPAIVHINHQDYLQRGDGPIVSIFPYIQCQGGHGTGKTGNLAVNFSRQGKHREFSKFNFLHRENCSNTGKILKI